MIHSGSLFLVKNYKHKKIIIYHFGIDDDYGSLPIREEENENVKDLIDAIMRVVDGGVYAPQDQAVVDRVKDLLQLDDDPSLIVQETTPPQPRTENQTNR